MQITTTLASISAIRSRVKAVDTLDFFVPHCVSSPFLNPLVFSMNSKRWPDAVLWYPSCCCIQWKAGESEDQG
jgi:hypothetical protein